MKTKLLSQGAEANIYLKKNITKDRIPKLYRYPALDEQLRKKRTKSEAKILEKLSKEANVPRVIKQEKFSIEIEYIPGERLSETLNKKSKTQQKLIIKKISGEISKIHNKNIIHGDLTTSNIILNKDKVFIIDFGLGYFSSRLEDKAVDLHLFNQALEAKHFQNYQELFNEFIKDYNSKDKLKILEQLKKVESRGRYKH